MYASAIGAVVAGCRHFFGYPITPSTEGAELMAKLLHRLYGHFVQAASEIAAINMVYGAAAGGVRAMTFTSSPVRAGRWRPMRRRREPLRNLSATSSG
jgi:pyruvate/2-oxoacid:ferredoxin oxidoreductase alpha subunit